MAIDFENYTIELNAENLEELDKTGYLDISEIELTLVKEEMAATIEDLLLGETVHCQGWDITYGL